MIAFFIINNAIPFMADDVAYAHFFPKESIKGAINGTDINHSICSFSEILESMYNHYFNLHGRSLLHVPVQLICGLWHNKIIYNIFSCVLFSILIVLLGKFSSKEKTFSFVGMFTMFLFGAFYVEPNSMTQGVAYGMNYIYAPVLCLSTFYLLVYFSTEKNVFQILICGLSFFAGWSHEGFVVPIGAGLFIYVLVNIKRIKPYQWIAFLLFSIGSLFLVLAPGNFRKAVIFSGILEQSRMNVLSFSRLSWILIVVILYLFIRGRSCLISFIKENYLWFTMWIFGIVFIAYIGALNERAVFAYELLASIILTKACLFLLKESYYKIIICLSASFLLVLSLTVIAFCQSTITKQFSSCEQQLAESSEDRVIVVVPNATAPSFLNRYLCSPLRHHYEKIWQDEWQWTVYEWQYSKETVVILEERQAPIFEKEYKMSGDNPFYRRGNYLYSIEPLPEKISATLRLGGYNVGSIEGICKNAISLINPPKPITLEVDYSVENMVCNGNMLYRIYVPENQPRLITDLNFAWKNNE